MTTQPPPSAVEAVTPPPQLQAEDLLAQLRGKFEQLCCDVTDAVNNAPAGPSGRCFPSSQACSVETLTPIIVAKSS